MNLLTKKDHQPTTETARRILTPRYDVRETGEAFVITASLPGVNASTLETTVDGDTLIILGRRAFTAPDDWTTVYRETPNADYRLVLDLDRRINRDTVRAELKQGVLTLTLPKAEAIKPRRIDIAG